MKEYLPYITTIIAILGFVFSVYKYIDLKNREEKRLNYENFSKILENLSGNILPDNNVFLESSFYIGNVYKLLEFPEYKYISLPILYLKRETLSVPNKKHLEHISKAIDVVIEKLNNM